MPTIRHALIVSAIMTVLATLVVKAQTTEFTYQGRLSDSSQPATGSYDFEFRLFAVEAGGAALGTQQRSTVAVANGSFTVKLDFGPSFDGSPRWLEIAVKPAGSADPLTVLSPRQPFTSAPYAIRSLRSMSSDTATNSAQLGGVAASQFVITSDPRLSDARTPLPGSGDYIHNTSTPQPNTTFNVTGNGRVGGTLTVDQSVVASNSMGGFPLFSWGSIGQVRNAGGVVKAMIYYDGENIARCYNGISLGATGTCGFTVTKVGTLPPSPATDPNLRYRIDFGFDVSDRFFSVTGVSAYAAMTAPTSLACLGEVMTNRNQCIRTFALKGENFDTWAPFFLIVF